MLKIVMPDVSGELLSIAPAFGCEDKGLRKAGKGLQTYQTRDSYAEHRIYVDRS